MTNNAQQIEIRKPKDFDTVRSYEEFERIELGGHKLVIKDVSVVRTQNGAQQLIISYDTSKGDRQPEFYAAAYRADTRTPKKWGGSTKLFIKNYDGTTNRQFKTFCTAVENSNPGFNTAWGTQFCAQFIGKSVGGVFGLEEYRNAEGKKTAIHKLFWFRKADNIEKIEIPKPRLLDDDQDAENSAFDDLVYMSDEDLPF